MADGTPKETSEEEDNEQEKGGLLSAVLSSFAIFRGGTRYESHDEGDGSSRTSSSWLYESEDRRDDVSSRRDNQDSREAHSRKNERSQSSAHGSPRLGKRTAVNYLNGEVEVPFPTVPPDVRESVERVTGKSLEESYEGLTVALGKWLDNEYLEDRSRPAKERNTGQRRRRE